MLKFTVNSQVRFNGGTGEHCALVTQAAGDGHVCQSVHHFGSSEIGQKLLNGVPLHSAQSRCVWLVVWLHKFQLFSKITQQYSVDFRFRLSTGNGQTIPPPVKKTTLDTHMPCVHAGMPINLQ